MVGGTNMYGSIFYQVYLLSWLTVTYFSLLLCNSGDMRKYVVIGLMKTSWCNQVLFVSFSEGTCVRCPLVNKSFQILHFILPGHCWSY